MELFLNLVGISVAAAFVCLWLRQPPCAGSGRKTQLVALALLILILFPVISVTDDLLAAQNLAETDSCVRRDYALHCVHPAPQIMAFAPAPLLVAHRFGILGFAGPEAHPLPAPSAPAIAPLENRPPPTA